MPDGNPQIIHGQDQETLRPEPKHFMRFNYEPADARTEAAVEAFRLKHDIRCGKGQKWSLCGFLMACKALKERDEKTFVWPSSKSLVPNYAANQRVKKTLLNYYFHQEGPTGCNLTNKATVYRFDEMPDVEGLRFQETAPRNAVEVRNYRQGADFFAEATGEILSERTCFLEFGEQKFRGEVERVKEVNSYLYDHPLDLNGDIYRYLVRKFNNRSLSHGGRLYGGYSSQKKCYRETATIAGEPIAQLDVKASFLFIRAALAKINLGEGRGDPYQRLPFVTGEDSRKFAKALLSAMISSGGTKRNMPSKIRKDHPAMVSAGQTMTTYQELILHEFPFLRDDKDGLHVMFRESEAILKVLELAIERDIPAWPLHDCIFVRKRDIEEGIQIIKEGFGNEFKFEPTISVNTLDGSPEYDI